MLKEDSPGRGREKRGRIWGNTQWGDGGAGNVTGVVRLRVI